MIIQDKYSKKGYPFSVGAYLQYIIAYILPSLLSDIFYMPVFD